jgi:outer membrane protein
VKKIAFILSLFLAVSSSVNAQTEKGRWQLGAQIGNFSYQTQNGGKNFSGSISPSAGYFIIDNLLIGTGVPVSYSAYRFPSNFNSVESATTSYGLSPFARYYIGKNHLKPYIGLAYSYSRTSTRQTQPDFTGQVTKQTTTGSVTNLVPTIGVAYFITDNVALNAGLNYSIQSISSEARDANMNPVSYSYKQNLLSLVIGFQLFFGK